MEISPFLANLFHTYTEALLSAVPTTDPDVEKERIILPGEIANPADPPSGCYFHPRCRYAKAIRREEEPALREVSPRTIDVLSFGGGTQLGRRSAKDELGAARAEATALLEVRWSLGLGVAVHEQGEGGEDARHPPQQSD